VETNSLDDTEGKKNVSLNQVLSQAKFNWFHINSHKLICFGSCFIKLQLKLDIIATLRAFLKIILYKSLILRYRLPAFCFHYLPILTLFYCFQKWFKVTKYQK
jgi:hypothetical protein